MLQYDACGVAEHFVLFQILYNCVVSLQTRIINFACVVQYIMIKYDYTHADLAGKTDHEQARADMIIDCFEDTYAPIIKSFFESDDAKKVWTDKRTLLFRVQ